MNWQTHHTKVLAQILVAQLNSPTPITPTRSRNGVISTKQAELLTIFCYNFQIFVAMATGVGLAQISLAQLNSPTPPRSRNGGRISHTSRGIANFLSEDTIELPDSKNFEFGANSVHVS